MTSGGRRIFALALALVGIAALGISLSFAMLPESVAAKDCEIGNLMLPFELAKTPDEMEALFGPPDQPCRELRLAAMDAQNEHDILFFIPAYALFMALAGWFLAGRLMAPLPLAAIACAVVAAAADLWETTALLQISTAMRADSDGPAAYLGGLAIAARLKFAVIGLHGLVIALICARLGRLYWIVGLAALAAALGNAYLLLGDAVQPSVQQVWLLATAASWLLVILAALVEIVRPRRVQS